MLKSEQSSQSIVNLYSPEKCESLKDVQAETGREKVHHECQAEAAITRENKFIESSLG